MKKKDREKKKMRSYRLDLARGAATESEPKAETERYIHKCLQML